MILEDIPFDEHPLGVFQFEKVLHFPYSLPRHRPRHVVVPHLDVRGMQVLNGGIGSAKHDDLAGALQIIVSDLEWARSIPAADRLAVESLCVTLRQVGIDHRCPRAVERDATAHVEGGMSMHIHADEDEIVRYLLQQVWCARTIAD